MHMESCKLYKKLYYKEMKNVAHYNTGMNYGKQTHTKHTRKRTLNIH